MGFWPKASGAGGVPNRVARPKLTVAQLTDLKTIHEHIILDPVLLVEIAARKGLTVRQLYERLIWDMAQIDADISRLNKSSQEAVNQAT